MATTREVTMLLLFTTYAGSISTVEQLWISKGPLSALNIVFTKLIREDETDFLNDVDEPMELLRMIHLHQLLKEGEVFDPGLILERAASSNHRTITSMYGGFKDADHVQDCVLSLLQKLSSYGSEAEWIIKLLQEAVLGASQADENTVDTAKDLAKPLGWVDACANTCVNGTDVEDDRAIQRLFQTKADAEARTDASETCFIRCYNEHFHP